MDVFSWYPNVSIEYKGAAGVPMAVPWVWSQYVSPKVKILFSMIVLRTLMNNSRGKSFGMRLS
jgi:hypothetical protein